jgi:hypothetical protein
VYVLDPGARHTSADVEALIVCGVTTPPPWLKVIAGVSADADTRSVWSVEVDRGEVAFVGAPRYGRFMPESVGHRADRPLRPWYPREALLGSMGPADGPSSGLVPSPTTLFQGVLLPFLRSHASS